MTKSEQALSLDNKTIPVHRTESEIDAYIDGYSACFNTYTNYLQSTSDIGEANAIMKTIVKTLKGLYKKEGEAKWS